MTSAVNFDHHNLHVSDSSQNEDAEAEAEGDDGKLMHDS